MSIYHLSVKNISRSVGRTACAAAAYRSGDRVVDKETGQINDYTRKRGVVYSEIDLPENAPLEFQNRETLWNAVQSVEKAKNARLCREVEVALPREIESREAQISLVREYVTNTFVKEGMCADWSIHDKGDGNPHAHIILTTRPLDKNGKWLTKERKEYALDADGNRIPILDENGQQKIGAKGRKLWKRITVKPNDWNARENVEKWRVEWAGACNRRLTKINAPTIDPRSYKRQGIARTPTIHEGAAAREIEERGGVSELCSKNRDIKAHVDDFMLDAYAHDLREIEAERKKIKVAEARRAAAAEAAAAKKNARPSARPTVATQTSKPAAPARAATVAGNVATDGRAASAPTTAHASTPPKPIHEPTALERFTHDPCAFVSDIDAQETALTVETFFNLSDREYDALRKITGDDALRKIAFGRDQGGRVYALAMDRESGSGYGKTGIDAGDKITFGQLHKAVIEAKRTTAAASEADKPAARAQETALTIAERGAVSSHIAEGLGKTGKMLKGVGADVKKIGAALDPTVSGKEKVKSGLTDIVQAVAQTAAKVILNFVRNPLKAILTGPLVVLGGAKDAAIGAWTASVGAVQSASEDERHADPQRVRKWQPPDDGGEGESEGNGR